MGKAYGNTSNIKGSRLPNYDLLESEVSSDNDLLSRDELIEALKKLPDDSKICITQDGNYAEGDLAYIFKTPFKISETENIFAIGHSDQNI